MSQKELLVFLLIVGTATASLAFLLAAVVGLRGGSIIAYLLLMAALTYFIWEGEQ